MRPKYPTYSLYICSYRDPERTMGHSTGSSHSDFLHLISQTRAASRVAASNKHLKISGKASADSSITTTIS